MAQWINDTQAIFETLQEPKKIFIASDNDEIVQRFVEHFEKNKVIILTGKGIFFRFYINVEENIDAKIVERGN